MTPKTAAIIYIATPIVAASLTGGLTHLALRKLKKEYSTNVLVPVVCNLAAYAAWVTTAHALEPLYKLAMPADRRH